MPMTPKKTSDVPFCINFRRMRIEAGITQCDLAQRSGLTYRQLLSYELGHATPNVDQAYAIAMALGGSMDEMCKSDNEQKKEEA